jgi:hypothetical protein
MSSLRTAVAAVGLVAIGYLLAGRRESASVVSPAAVAPPPRPAPLVARADVDVDALKASIRDAVRAELAARVAGASPGEATGDDAAPAEPAATADQAAAVDRAQTMIAGIVVRGHFTMADTLALRPVLAAARPADAMELRRSIVRAINADHLIPDGHLVMP